jgi:hypothetical protein
MGFICAAVTNTLINAGLYRERMCDARVAAFTPCWNNPRPCILQLTALAVTGPVAATGARDVKIEQGSNQLVLFARAIKSAQFSAENYERALILEE